MDIFDLKGEAVLATEKSLGLIVCWNGSATFNIYLVSPNGGLEALECYSEQEPVKFWSKAAEIAQGLKNNYLASELVLRIFTDDAD